MADHDRIGPAERCEHAHESRVSRQIGHLPAFRRPAAKGPSRIGKNKQHGFAALLCQSIYSRLAGYEEVNGAQRLAVDPALRHIVGGRTTQLIRAQW